MRVIAGNNRARNLALLCLVLGLVLLAASEGSAQLKILRVNKGGSAPTNAVGGGTLTSVFNAACDYWEKAIKDTHTVTIEYRWAPLSGGTLGAHTLVAQSGTPNRETKASIDFDSDGTSLWFIDPTPFDNLEYNTLTQTTQNFGGGTVNKGRVYTSPTGNAVNRSDLLAVCIHEVGHSLGLSAANNSFKAENTDGDIDIRSPLPYSGSALPTSSGSAHLNISTALMYPSISKSIRRVPSNVDILTNAEISKFTGLNLDPNATCINSFKYLPDGVFSNAGNVFPLSTSFGGGEGRYQWFIHRSKLGCKGLIKQIYVRPLTSYTLKASLCEIRISHTTQSAHSTNMNTNLPKPVVVRPAGAYEFNGTATSWSSLGLTKGFVYDGHSNLTIEIRLRGMTQTPSGSHSCDRYSTSTDTGFRRTYAYGSGSYSTSTASTSNASSALKLRLEFGEPVYCPDDLDPATNGNNSYPFNSTAKSWRYQYLIKAAELPNKRFKIEDVAFANASGLTSFYASQFQVRMGHTTRTVLSTNFASNFSGCPIDVYYGSLYYKYTPDQWAAIGLQKPFGYDGVRNLVVEIRYSGRSSTVSTYFRSNTKGTPRAWANSTTVKSNYAATTATGTGTTYGLKSMLSIKNSMTAQCTEKLRIGSVGAVYLYGAPVGQAYRMATSFTQAPPIPIQSVYLYLVPDTLFYISVLMGPPTFQSYAGVASKVGTAKGTFAVPKIPQLIGFCLYHQGLTYITRGGVTFTNASNACGTQLTL